MAEIRQKLRGTTLQLDQYIGRVGQIAVNTQNNEIRVYDGTTLGGHRIPTLVTAAEAFQLPPRLTPTGGEIDNCNDALEAGFYRTEAGAANQPVAGGGVKGTLVVYPWDGGRIQEWTASDNSSSWRRSHDGVTWAAWIRQVDFTIGDTRYLGISAKAADSELLDGQEGSYYANISGRLGYVPVNKAGDIMSGGLSIQHATPFLKFLDSDDADFTFTLNAGILTLSADRDSTGGDEAPTPFSWNSVSNKAFAFGGQVWSETNQGAGSGMNADKVDGFDSSVAVVADTIPVRGSDGHLRAALFRSELAGTANNNAYFLGQRALGPSGTTDNVVRPMTLTEAAALLDDPLATSGAVYDRIELRAQAWADNRVAQALVIKQLASANQIYLHWNGNLHRNIDGSGYVQLLDANNVRAHLAGFAFTDLGSYIIAKNISNTGGLIGGAGAAGSSLQAQSCAGVSTLGGALPGSWRTMGVAAASGTTNEPNKTTLFLRYA